MEECKVKTELIDMGSDVSEVKKSFDENKTKQESKDNDEAPIVSRKKRNMEIELDFSLIKYEPRTRRNVVKYEEEQTEPLRKRKRNDDNNKPTKIYKDLANFCEICNQGFQSARRYKAHISVMHRKPENFNKFTCALCSEIFDSNTKLIKHKIIHKDEERNFLCMTCKTAFSDHLEFLKHSTKHQHNRSYFCIECSKEFDEKKPYITHIEKHYTELVQCKLCHREMRLINLKIHMEAHAKTQKITCVECGQEINKDYMKHHMTTHTGVKPYQCLYCGKGFCTAQQRMVHTRIHTNEKPFECKICHKKFHQSGDRKRHEERHSTNTTVLQCEVCSVKFTRKESLVKHMDIHNNTQKYTCTICGAKYHTGTSLRSHVERTHTEGKPYKCIPCDIAFKTNSDLIKHRKLAKHKNNEFGYNKRQMELNGSVNN